MPDKITEEQTIEITQQAIQDRIDKLEEQRGVVMDSANAQINQIVGAIQVLKDILTGDGFIEEKEPPELELEKPK